jgi:hypothetical protein
MIAPFSMYEVENTITEESAGYGDYASSETSPEEPATLREALDALLNGCWDRVDGRADGRADCVIAYPADYEQDMYSGDWSGTEVIINGPPRQITRLLNLYEARKRF